MKKTKKLVKDYVGAGLTLGVGSMALGAMGQGQIASKIATPASNMMGVGIQAGMGMSIMDMANKYSKDGKAVRVKKGKHKGYGEW